MRTDHRKVSYEVEKKKRSFLQMLEKLARERSPEFFKRYDEFLKKINKKHK